MKSAFLVLIFTIGLVAGGSKPVLAEVNYPWCLIMGGRDGSWNCGFVTWQQCQATRLGTDMCVQNPRYVQPAQPRRR